MSSINSAEEKPLASIWNCLTCRCRKVRCDRKNPCSHCARSGTPCVFPQSGRLPRRPPATTVGEHSEGLSRDLLSRIRRLEGIINSFNVEPEHGSQPHLQGAPGSAPEDGTRAPTAQTGLHTEGSQSKGEAKEGHQLAGFLVSGEGGKLYIGGDFWSTLRQEVSSIREAFETEEEDDKRTSPLPLDGMASCSTSSSKGSPRDHSTWIFQSPYTFGNTVIDPMLPMPSQMFFTWQAYVENIDPFLKIVHVPTITEALRSSKCYTRLIFHLGKQTTNHPRITELYWSR
ncbi:hypothetical protein FALCPG4_013833 [Fusarium falciforme]